MTIMKRKSTKMPGNLSLAKKYDLTLKNIAPKSQEIAQSGNMGCKTPIYFDLRKYVEKHCNGRSKSTTKENKASYNTDYIAPDLIDFFGNDWKKIRTQVEIKNINIREKNIVLSKK